MNLNGTLSVGYNGDYSNFADSDHSINGSGMGTLSGSYFNPNFLSFTLQPFYDQSRLNSSFQSVTSSSGLSGNAAIFSGSNFPGSVSFSKTYNSSGNFSVPGISDFTTHGNNDTFGITWGVHLDDLPRLNLSFSEGNNGYSVYGADTRGNSHFNSFMASTTYRIAGFNLNGSYQHTGSQQLTPQLLTAESQQSSSGGNTLSFGVGHTLPMHGVFSAGASRSNLTTDAGDTSFKTTIDTLNSNASFAPIKNLNVGAGTSYTDNLEGTLYNSLLSAGVLAPQWAGQQTSSNSLGVTSYVSYDIPRLHLHLRGSDDREQQRFFGEKFVSNSYNGNATYSTVLFRGQFNGVLGVTRSTVSSVLTDQSTVGMTASANYIREIQRWTVSGGLSYSHNTQTVLAAYTSSGYGYTGSLGRRLGRRSHWGATASGSKSMFDQSGSATLSQSYSTSLSLPHLGISGSYSKSSGNALLTATGLVASPVPLPILLPGSLIFYNGKSYSLGVGSSPMHGLTLTAMYSKALSGTQSALNNSSNSNQNMNFLVVYRVRKLDFQAGYSRLVQGFSFSGTGPTMMSSYYFGISRWFNVF